MNNPLLRETLTSPSHLGVVGDGLVLLQLQILFGELQLHIREGKNNNRKCANVKKKKAHLDAFESDERIKSARKELEKEKKLLELAKKEEELNRKASNALTGV